MNRRLDDEDMGRDYANCAKFQNELTNHPKLAIRCGVQVKVLWMQHQVEKTSESSGFEAAKHSIREIGLKKILYPHNLFIDLWTASIKSETK